MMAKPLLIQQHKGKWRIETDEGNERTRSIQHWMMLNLQPYIQKGQFYKEE
jgi:hypothetical protein